VRRKYRNALALAGSFVLGALSGHNLEAQATPPAYVVAEVHVKDQGKFEADFLPSAAKAVEEAGGTYVSRGGRTMALQGTPPLLRVLVMKFESLGKVQAWWNSPARKNADVVGEKYATFRVFAVEGR
jgi:uncharacterized protein (DUF1330 family)